MHTALYAASGTEFPAQAGRCYAGLANSTECLFEPRHQGAATPLGGDEVVTRAQRWALGLLLPLTCASCCRPGSDQHTIVEQDEACAGPATLLDNVWWPGQITRTRLEGGRAARRMFERARSVTLPSDAGAGERSLELAKLGAAAGDLELAVRASKEALAFAPTDDAARSFAAASLLARYFTSGTVADLLDATEILAAFDGGDISARCNRVRAYGELGLRYRVRDRVPECPCACPAEREMAAAPDLDGRRHSADTLPPGDFQRVGMLLDNSEKPGAQALVEHQSQAWRVFLEREALKLWVQAGPDERPALIRRMLEIAALYEANTANPLPLELYTRLSRLTAREIETLEAAVPLWLDGAQALVEFRPEVTVQKLAAARPLIERTAPPLLPAIDLTLAGAKYHLGDASAMRTEAAAVRDVNARAAAPAAWARALWLEAVALQAEADWDESLHSAEVSRGLYATLKEPANAGYLDSIRAYAFESIQAEEEAQTSYLSSVRHTAAVGDSRLLAGALWLFSQEQGRLGRPNLAVELQRESTVLDSAEGATQLISEAKAILAEHLFRANRQAEARIQLAQAKDAASRIESERPRQRALALIAQAEANGDAERDPAAAELALTTFLDNFESFGERVKRAEALLRRAKTRIAQGKIEGAEHDLTAALQEISAQSARLRDRVRAVVLIDMARETLERLVEVLLRQDPTGGTALVWVERLRDDQTLRGLGGSPPALEGTAQPLPMASDVCLTEFFSLPRELLSWTFCGAESPVLQRTIVPRDQLLTSALRFRASARSGGLDQLRTASAEISNWLVKPQERYLSGARYWVVIPDALLPAAPYPWLSTNGRFLFHSAAVMTATSISALRFTSSQNPTSWSVAAFGDPAPATETASVLPRLPHAANEVARIQLRFPDARGASGTAATWTKFVAAARQSTLLHFAGHITGGSRVPLGARMIFASEPGRLGGRIAADEVARTNLSNVRLVVLAGCASGSDTPTRIAGSLDFARAFQRAGADQVLGTLWDVPDLETSEILARFYDFLIVDRAPEAALRNLLSERPAAALSHAELATLSSLQLTSALVRGMQGGSK